MKRVMIIDALNAYLRAYIVDPSLSSNGQPIGGIKGFLKILQKLVRDMNPDQVVVVWDGPNGSRKRKTMDKNYKEGRKPIRLNRAFHNLTNDEELQNKMWQQGRIIQYLNNMPIIQSMIEEVEADDIIAYITQMKYYEGWQKIIIGAVLTTVVWILATYLTPQDDEVTLRNFVKKVNPGGPGWSKYSDGISSEPWPVPNGILCMVLGCVAVYGFLLGVGQLSLLSS